MCGFAVGKRSPECGLLFSVSSKLRNTLCRARAFKQPPTPRGRTSSCRPRCVRAGAVGSRGGSRLPRGHVPLSRRGDCFGMLVSRTVLRNFLKPWRSRWTDAARAFRGAWEEKEGLCCVGWRTMREGSLEPPVAQIKAHTEFLPFNTSPELLLLSCGQVWEVKQCGREDGRKSR